MSPQQKNISIIKLTPLLNDLIEVMKTPTTRDYKLLIRFEKSVHCNKSNDQNHTN